jgi:hypothetical protein
MKLVQSEFLKDVQAGAGPAGAAAGCAAGAAAGAGAGSANGSGVGAGNGGATGAAAGGAAGAAAGAAVGCAVGAAVGAVGGVGAAGSAGGAAGGVAGAAAASCATSSCGGGGGGGKVICTELCRNGAIEHDVWMADIRYSRENFSEQTMRGYHLWGIPYVRLMRKYPTFAKLAENPTRWFAEDIAYRMGVLSKPNYKGWVLREVLFRPVCFGIGLFANARDWQALWRDGDTPAGVRY